MTRENGILKSLAKAESQLVRFEADEVLFKKNMPITYLHFIENGLVKVVEQKNSGDRISLLIGKGGYIDLTDVLTRKNHSQTVYAADITTVRIYGVDGLRNSLLGTSESALDVINSIRIHDLMQLENYIHMLKLPVEKRVIRFLLWLAEEVYFADEFTIKIDKVDLASYLATSTKTLNRVINQFRNEGFLFLAGKKIKILDHKAMHMLLS